MIASAPSWFTLLSRALPGAASATALLISGLVLLRWAFDLGPMHNVASGLPTMTPITALASLLAAVSLWLVQAERTGWRQRVATLCSLVVVVMVGLLTLIEYVLEWNVGIEPRLDGVATGAPQSAAMAPATGFGLLLVGSALLLWGGPLSLWLVRGLGLLAALLSIAGLVGFLAGGRSLSGAGPYATMAPATAVTLLVLSLGLLGLRRRGPAPVRSRRPERPSALRPALLVGAGLALSVAAIGAVGSLSYLQAERSLRAEYAIRLGSLAEERQRALALILREQLMALQQLAQSAPIQDVARRLRNAEPAMPRATLSGAQARTAFQGLFLAAAPGSLTASVLAQAGPRHIASGSFEGTSLGLWAADVAGARNQPWVRFEAGEDGNPVLLLGVPVEDPTTPTRPLGVLLARADPRSIQELFAGQGGLGATGESFLADRLGRPLTGLRYALAGHDEGATHEIEAPPMQRCLQGGSSALTVVPDYESIPTVMAYRPVPEIGGGCLMVHIRAEEVFASTGRLQVQQFSLIGLALFVVVGGLLIIGARLFHDLFRERLRQRLALRRDMERTQRLQLSVSQLLIEPGAVEQTMAQLLATIGAGMGWHLGRCWMRQSGSDALRCEAVWPCLSAGRPAPSVLGDDSASHPRTSAGFSGGSCSGPPLGGETRHPTWDPDLDKDGPPASLPVRGAQTGDSAAVPAGMRCRLRLPVRVDGEVSALLEFFSRESRPKQDAVLRAMADLGSKVGQFLARKRVEVGLAEASERLAAQNQELVQACDAALEGVRLKSEFLATLKTHASQQAAVAALGRQALATLDPIVFMQEVVAEVSRVLDITYCKILELQPDGGALVLRAGVGWHEGLVGVATVGTGADSQAGYTLQVGEPVVVKDLRTESRFHGPPLLHDHHIVSGISVTILGQDQVFGVLGAHADRLRDFTQDDVRFVESVAGLLGAAMDRFRSRSELQRQIERAELSAREKARILASVHAFFISVAGDGTVSEWAGRSESLFGIDVSEAIGRPLTDLPIDWNWTEIQDAMSRAAEMLQTVRIEKIRCGRPGRKDLFLHITVSSLCEDKGIFHVFMGEDVTERLELERELMQAQKLESIGQLAAGIAHEINTPTQFVGDNTRFVSDSFAQLREMVGRYREVLAALRRGGASEETLQRLDAAEKTADLTYVLEEVPKALAQSIEGIERIAHIVRAMKEFAHPDTGEMAAVDLNKAIESTITVARNEWKYVAEMVTDFDPALPPVRCLPGEVNQVILNLIVNAAHAIGDVVKQAGGKGTITVSTRLAGAWAEIRVVDTGTGIPEAIQGRIFDPFFTTKEVGRGTGQGLSIARTVVMEKHGGSLTFESAVGHGTTFLIRLPLGSPIAEPVGSQPSRFASDQAGGTNKS
ncbi:MAG: GAF domain-containing protein [Nitrospira sp.]|nr:MAG: GAF domain-containing protein [Nitrospira sp.]